MNERGRELLRRISIRGDPLPARLSESPIWGYGLAVLSTLTALAATYLLQPYVFRTSLFFLAILLSSWIGGRRPGLLAVLLSTLSIRFVPSPEELWQHLPTMFPVLSAFLLTALLVGGWSLKRRHAEHALREARDTLETRVQERTAELNRYIKRLEAWRKITEGIIHARSLEEIAGAVLNSVTALVPCQGAIITLLDFEARQEVVFASQFGRESQLVSKLPISFADSPKLNERLSDLRQGHVIVVDDVRTLPYYPVIQTAIEEGIRSVVLAPLFARGELIGEFDLGADHPGAFGPEAVDIIREKANLLAIAIAQARLFEEVVASRDRLHLLKQQLVKAQETERRRLGQELHDRIGQNLTALSINLSIMSNRRPTDLAADLGPRLNYSVTLVEDTAEVIHDITSELSSPVLDDYGLEAAIREYAQRYQQRTGTAVEFQPDIVAERLRPEEQLTLYRIGQEALTNIAKHAQASQVTIALETTDQVRRLVIADNGVGFDPDSLRTAAEGHGLGLLSIRDRAESIGGKLHVESSPGHGTRLIVELKR